MVSSINKNQGFKIFKCEKCNYSWKYPSVNCLNNTSSVCKNCICLCNQSAYELRLDWPISSDGKFIEGYSYR